MTDSRPRPSAPTAPPRQQRLATHEVFNQSAALVDYNVYAGDDALREAVTRHGADWAHESLHAHGARTGSAVVFEFGFLAYLHAPQFEAEDRQGFRFDEVQ